LISGGAHERRLFRQIFAAQQSVCSKKRVDGIDRPRPDSAGNNLSDHKSLLNRNTAEFSAGASF
jgi:hypothetical protein